MIWAFVTRSEGLARQLVYRSRETGAVSVSKAVPKHDSAENLSRARPELRFAMSLWPQRGRVGKGAELVKGHVRSNVGPMWSNVTSISHPPSVPCASESEILTLDQLQHGLEAAGQPDLLPADPHAGGACATVTPVSSLSPLHHHYDTHYDIYYTLYPHLRHAVLSSPPRATTAASPPTTTASPTTTTSPSTTTTLT